MAESILGRVKAEKTSHCGRDSPFEVVLSQVSCDRGNLLRVIAMFTWTKDAVNNGVHRATFSTNAALEENVQRKSSNFIAHTGKELYVATRA